MKSKSILSILMILMFSLSSNSLIAAWLNNAKLSDHPPSVCDFMENTFAKTDNLVSNFLSTLTKVPKNINTASHSELVSSFNRAYKSWSNMRTSTPTNFAKLIAEDEMLVGAIKAASENGVSLEIKNELLSLIYSVNPSAEGFAPLKFESPIDMVIHQNKKIEELTQSLVLEIISLKEDISELRERVETLEK